MDHGTPQSYIPRIAKYAPGGCLEFCFDFTGNVGVHFDVSCILYTSAREHRQEKEIQAHCANDSLVLF
jgi:hypothetical protein